LAEQVATVFAAGRLAERYNVLPFDRDVLTESFQAVWANIHRQAVKSLRRDPVREFVRNLNDSQEQLLDLDGGPPTLTKSEAKQTLFKKTQKDGRVAIFLTSDVFAGLAPQAQPVLHWLQDRGFLHRDGKAGNGEGTTGKRQTKVVVARKRSGSPIRLSEQAKCIAPRSARRITSTSGKARPSGGSRGRSTVIAFDEEDRNESISKWRRVFEDDFARGIVEAAGANVSVAALDESRRGIDPAGFFEDIVAKFQRVGRLMLPTNFDRMPYKVQPRWRRAPEASRFGVEVVTARYTHRGGTFLDWATSGGRVLPKGQAVRFEARTNVGAPIGGGFEVHWRITNTDREAAAARALRGRFESPNEGQSRWEDLEYRGVHTAEAFVVRKRDNALVAQSAPFYVVIE
jgi:hypothetical protein